MSSDSGLPAPVTVVIVDDEEEIRRLLRVNLDFDERFEVLADVEDGTMGLAATVAMEPRLLVLDLMMPGMDGAEVLRQVKRRSPGTKVAMFTAATVRTASSLTNDEAHAYICKTDDITQVADVLARVAAGERMTVEHARGRVVRLS